MASVLSRLLSNSAEACDEKIAVTCAGHSLTYGALERESSRLAHLLRREGVQPGDRVALYLNKSVESVLGIFAVLKAGAAYVPLDPMAPPQRLTLIVNDCGVRHVLTTAAKVAVIAEGKLGEAIEFGLLMDMAPSAIPASATVRWRRRGEAAGEPDSAPDVPISETDLAYILYTSGSTGVPKGVMISHRNALAFVDWAADCFDIRPDDRLSNHAPFHFDLSVFDLYAAIRNGASVHLVPEMFAFFPASLIRFMEDNRITVWYSVPSVLTLLLQHGNLGAASLPDLRVVLFAGEVFPAKHLRALMQTLPRPRYANLYGPTETNVCTWYEVPAPPEGDAPIPVGRACSGDEVFALDEQGRRVGTGEEGILHVRGPTVMMGYWARTEQTAEVLSETPGGDRVYRTGDLVVPMKDGNFRFLGRRDHQVKSRGYRIELGEVEAALLSHPDIAEAVVVPVPDEEIGHRLRALVVAAGGKQPAPAELTQHCAQRIPKYMIPESIDARPQLPKTSTGKIDRQRLLREILGGSG